MFTEEERAVFVNGTANAAAEVLIGAYCRLAGLSERVALLPNCDEHSRRLFLANRDAIREVYVLLQGMVSRGELG